MGQVFHRLDHSCGNACGKQIIARGRSVFQDIVQNTCLFGLRTFAAQHHPDQVQDVGGTVGVALASVKRNR